MFLKSEFGSIYYEVKGPENAPAVIFTHGGGLNGDMFLDQVSALKDRFRVITWDLPGHGRSAKLEEKLDIIKMGEIMVNIMDELGIEKAVAVGQSLGVYVNQHAAVNYPDRIRAIVSIGGLPIDILINRLELTLYKVGLALSRWFPEKFIFQRSAKEKARTKKAREFFFKSMSEMGKEQFLLMLSGQIEVCEVKVEKAPSQPLLITHGEHEMPKSLIKANRKWHEAVPGSRYFEIPGAGHNANMDKPWEFNRVLLEFLGEL